MAAYLKDVEGDTVDLTAQEIIRNKHNRKIEEPSKVSIPRGHPSIDGIKTRALEKKINKNKTSRMLIIFFFNYGLGLFSTSLHGKNIVFKLEIFFTN